MTSFFPAFAGNQPKSSAELQAWHARALPEPVLEPELGIVDPHHHLYDDPGRGSRYMLPDLLADIGQGHRVTHTVYVEAYSSMWRASGPEAMRPVGEIEFAAGVGAMADSGIYGPCRVAAAVVGHADLMLGDAVGAVLDEQLSAARGRLRGIRYQLAHEPGVVGRFIKHMSPPDCTADPQFHRGMAQLAPRGLHFEAWLYHHQLRDLAALARAFPDTTVVLNHVGGRIGVEQYRDQRAEVLAEWRAGLAELAALKNVVVKIGGLGMAVFGFGFEHGSRPAASKELLPAWQPLIAECIDRFGADRCMFESNFPVDRQSCSYLALWNTYKQATAALPAHERHALFSGTAKRVYRIA
ncbi:amidohydrolase family protein [Ottowia sp. VDI28]|uniref:amidohydrolase family protein n=1 Tax=Ottowia sp. VDI28 TaxID=3133968 RepID=UPI003C2B6B33